MLESSKTSIIIPAYNEEAGLPIVLEKLFTLIDENYEVIVVDDGSIDATKQIASQFPCTLIVHENNCGKAEAMKSGVEKARGDNVIFIDADNTYPVDAIPDMAKYLEYFDMVVTSRTKGRGNIPLFNRIGNFIFSRLIRYLHGSRVRDPLSGLYGIKKTHFKHMQLNSKGFTIETEIAIKSAKMKLKVTELAIKYDPRLGEQKLGGVKDGWEILKTILREKFRGRNFIKPNN